MVLVFFIYGLAFFCLGVIVALYPRKGSSFKLAGWLGYIASFGILHGFNEWVDMFILIRGEAVTYPLQVIRTALLPGSFAFLMAFGLKGLRPGSKGPWGAERVLPLIMLAVWGLIVFAAGRSFLMADVWARYLIGLPGSLMTALVLARQSAGLKMQGAGFGSGYLKVGAIGFLAYGFLAGLVVPDAGFFPSNSVNYGFFKGTIGVPVQLFRALCAVTIAFGLLNVLRIFDHETKEELRKSRDELDLRVKDRTMHLIEANEDLEQEISIRRKAEEALNRARVRAETEKSKTEAVVSCIGDGIIIQDLNFRVTFENEHQRRTWGDHVGEYCYRAYEGRDSMCEDCPMVLSLDDGRIHKVERHVHANGEDRYLELKTSALVGPGGEIKGGVKVVRDITDQKLAERKILESLREKEVLLQEIHHRVKNNMQVISSLLKLQCRTIKDPETVRLFGECRSRIRTMALIHESLYMSGDLENIDFGRYVRSLVGTIVKSFGPEAEGVTVKVLIEEIQLNADTAVPCGLIINELVSNSLKYAFPDRSGAEVKVSMTRQEDGGLVLSVGDNGVGLPEGIGLEDPSTLGLELVGLLVRQQLGGTIEINRSGGTEFVMRFMEINYKKRI